jgi:hypothetical protein
VLLQAFVLKMKTKCKLVLIAHEKNSGELKPNKPPPTIKHYFEATITAEIITPQSVQKNKHQDIIQQHYEDKHALT